MASTQDHQWLRRGARDNLTCVYVYSPFVQGMQNIQQPSPIFNTYPRRALSGDANMRFSHTLRNCLSINRLQSSQVIKRVSFRIQHEKTGINLCERYAFALRYMVFRNTIHGLWCLDTWSFATR